MNFAELYRNNKQAVEDALSSMWCGETNNDSQKAYVEQLKAIIKNIFAKKQDSIVVRYSKIIVCSVLFVLCVAALANQSYNPFIYFRF